MVNGTSMGEKPEGKWAIEAFDFLRLFRRIGRSFVGLLFLEFGWTAYTLLLQRVMTTPWTLKITLPPWLGIHTPLDFPINVSTIYAVGLASVLCIG